MRSISSLCVTVAALGLFLMPSTARSDEPATTIAPGKTGQFVATFTERSPLSSMKELATRLKDQKPPADYDLGTQHFVICVPASYDPAKPAGICLLFNYKHSDVPAESFLTSLAEHNLLFVTLQVEGQSPGLKVGLGLDAVHNLRKLYAVDADRVYLISLETSGGGQLLALSYPEVIRGTFYWGNAIKWWKQIPTKNRSFFPAEAKPPQQPYLGKAKLNPMVVAGEGVMSVEHNSLLAKSATADGFKNVKTMTVTAEQIHYPNLTTDWFEEAIKYLDDHRAASSGAATRPGASPRPAELPAK